MKHLMPIEIRFADIDKFQHVNNAVYLTYAEQARISYFDDVLGNSIDWQEWGLILAKAELNYLQPIVLKDKCEVETECVKIGNKSLHLFYKIFKLEKDNTKTEMCNGTTILVGYNYKTKASIEIPVIWKEKINNFVSL